MSALTEMGKRAKEAAVVLATLPSPRKNKALLASADALLAAEKEILAANAADVAAAEAAGVKGAFIDRLTLTVKRLAEMADGLRQVAALDDPVGEMLSMKTLDNGLIIGGIRHESGSCCGSARRACGGGVAGGLRADGAGYFPGNSK